MDGWNAPSDGAGGNGFKACDENNVADFSLLWVLCDGNAVEKADAFITCMPLLKKSGSQINGCRLFNF